MANEINIQDLNAPDIQNPTTANRASFVRGWNEFLASDGTRPNSLDAKGDRWRRVGWRAGETFVDLLPVTNRQQFMWVVFLWSVNQRKAVLGWEPLAEIP